jgi:hypothetical protein
MVHQRDVGARPARAQRHPQRVEHQRGAHVARELPADHAAAVGVQYEREEHQALPAAQVGQIRDPEPIRRRSAEVAPDEIRSPACRRIERGRAPGLATPLGTLDPVDAHQPLDPVTTDLDARALERQPRPPIAIAVIVRGVKLLNSLEQPLIADDSR